MNRHKKFLVLVRESAGSGSWSVFEEFDSLLEFENWLKRTQIYGEYLLVEVVNWHVSRSPLEEE